MKNKAKVPKKTKLARKPSKPVQAPEPAHVPESDTRPPFPSIPAPTGHVLHVESIYRTAKMALHFDLGSRSMVIEDIHSYESVYLERNDVVALLECLKELGTRLNIISGEDAE